MADYRVVSYETDAGPRAGMVVGEELYPLSESAAGLPGSVIELLQRWREAEPMLEQAAAKIASEKRAGKKLAQVKLLSPVLYPSAVYCAGANYGDHAAEMARAANRPPPPDPHEAGLKPWHFMKAPRAIVASDVDVAIPPETKKLDWEAELAAVIGRPAKAVSEASALDYVAGYLVANDLSARDLSRRKGVPETSGFHHDWISHKSFDGSCPLGPWLVPAKQVGDPQKLDIKLWVNDVIKQDSNTAKMLFSLAEQIAFLSGRVTLHPGDVVLTGTPAGVGNGRGEYLNKGDVVKVWIEKVGTITNKMV
jgi:2-keto-4-pentenoate hydratase/2-oxohepta-3-ene-1,7-dioic acid hydratase in catechol pathway